MEIFTTEDDNLTVLPDTDGKIRFTINKVSIVLPHMTAAIVSVAIQQILRETYKKRRNTKRPK